MRTHGRTCFSGAVEILDYYHAHEYLVEIIDLLYGKNTELGKQQIENWKDMLFEDRVSEVRKVPKMSSPSEPHSTVTDLINTGIAEMPHESVWKKFVMHPPITA